MVGKGKRHAKVILSGDYAVLYGEPAVAGGLQEGGEITLKPVSWSFELKNDRPIDQAQWGLLEKACRKMSSKAGYQGAFQVSVENEVPVGAGLGASAAFCLGFARVLDSLDEAQVDLLEIASAGEEILPGYPSNIDL